MASERFSSRRRVRRRRSAVRRAWLYCFLLTLPALIFVTIYLYQKQISLAPALLLVGCLLIYLLVVAAALGGTYELTPDGQSRTLEGHASRLAVRFRKGARGAWETETVDNLPGPLIGRAKSATLRTADVVGLDIATPQVHLRRFIRFDLRDEDSIAHAAASIGTPLDALFHCAGQPQTAPGLDVLLTGFVGLRELTERLRPSLTVGGSITCVASTAETSRRATLSANWEMVS